MKNNWKDAMTPKERLAAFAAGKPIDRIPCIPMISNLAFYLAGGPMPQYYHSAELAAKAQIHAFETYECDSIDLGPGLFGIAEAIGTKLSFPVNGIPFVAEPAISNYADLDKLPMIDPYRSGRLSIILESLRLAQEMLGDRADVGGEVGGPVTIAAALRGTEAFLKDLHRCPENVHKLLQFVTDNVLLVIDVLSEMGIKPSIAEPVASGTMISDKQFREFAKPYLQQYAERIQLHWGSGPFVHICGDTRKIWDDIVDLGASVLSLDNKMDMAEAKEAVGSRVCLAGNIKPEALWRGTPDQIADEVKTCLRKCWDNPKGFILASGCGTPLGAPTENIIAMMEAARLYGRWPIDPERLK